MFFVIKNLMLQFFEEPLQFSLSSSAHWNLVFTAFGRKGKEGLLVR